MFGAGSIVNTKLVEIAPKPSDLVSVSKKCYVNSCQKLRTIYASVENEDEN